MKIINKNCETYVSNFSKPNSFMEALFAPRKIMMQDGTSVERMQRWLIDSGDFYTRAEKSLNSYTVKSRHSETPFIRHETVNQYLDNNFFVESTAGFCFYLTITSMLFRSIQLFFQNTSNPLNFSAFHPKTQARVNFFISSAVIAFTFCLGHDWKDVIVFFFLPILLEKVLSFTWSNYFKQINMLSSTKDFNLRDFILKNIQAALIRTFPPAILILLKDPQFFKQNSLGAALHICKTEPIGYSIDFKRASDTVGELLLEPMMLSLGKIIYDLAYILILKTFDKDADLRDPMGWLFSKFRRPVPCPVHRTVGSQEQEEKHTRKSRKQSTLNTQVISPDQNDVLSNLHTPSTAFSDAKDFTQENPEQGRTKIKQKTHSKGYPSPVPKTDSTPKEPKTCINIEVGGWVRTFQKIESPLFKKEVWGIIIADSVEKQKLTKYEKLLSNGKIGGGVRQLIGWSDRYEIGAKMGTRLIGKMYNSGVYHSLQSFMHMEDALQLSQELERYGIQDDVSLIVFSVEAKTHKDIAPVARKL